MNDEDWLNEPAHDYPVAKPDADLKPASTDLALPLAEGMLDKAIAAGERRGQFIAAWGLLTEQQRMYLNTWRECRFNGAKTLRVLTDVRGISKTGVIKWADLPAFRLALTMMRQASVEEILHHDYLVARQEDIVETLLTPQPILHQGFATGHFEVQAAAAGKANETLLKLGGHLKEDKQDINVGIVGPSFTIQVMQNDGSVKDVTPRGVTVQLPEPAEDSSWLE